MKHLLTGLSLAIFFFAASLGVHNAGSEDPYGGARRVIAMPAERHITHASWYGPRFFGHTMACGAQYNKDAVFTAHKTYPLGTKLVVTNLRNHRSIVVPVEDRGPYVGPGRDLDLSYAAAKRLDMIQAGVVLISYTPIVSQSSEGGFAQ